MKFASPAASEGVVAEIRELRKALGDDHMIACDMHWTETYAGALNIARQMAPYNPWFLEAPIASEDVEGLSKSPPTQVKPSLLEKSGAQS